MNKRILQLDGMRFLMFLMIFWGHCTFLNGCSYGWFQKTFSNASLPLDFFFMLSGFGIYYSYNDKSGIVDKLNLVNSIRFAISKVKKIYPFYIVSLLVFLPFYLDSLRKILIYILQFVINSLLIQALIPSVTFSHGINGVCWFLSTIFISYIFCPLFFYIVKSASKMKLLFISVFTLCLTILLYVISIAFDGTPFHVLGMEFAFGIGSSPYIQCPKLLLGMILARLCLNTKFTLNKYVVAASLAGIYTFHLLHTSLIHWFGHAWWLEVFQLALTSLLFVALSRGQGGIIRFFSSKQMVTMGSMAMFLYLFHYPIIEWANFIRANYFVNPITDIAGIIELIVIILICSTLVLLIWGKSYGNKIFYRTYRR